MCARGIKRGARQKTEIKHLTADGPQKSVNVSYHIEIVVLFYTQLYCTAANQRNSSDLRQECPGALARFEFCIPADQNGASAGTDFLTISAAATRTAHTKTPAESLRRVSLFL